MNLDDTEKEIYGQLNVEEQSELQAMWSNTDLWNKLPKMAAALIAVGVLLAIVF